MTKAFLAFLVAALILGGMLGLAFTGGVALGKTQGQDAADARGPGRISADTDRPVSGGVNRNQGGGLRDGDGRQGFRPGGAGGQGAGDRFQEHTGDGAEGRGSGRDGQRGVFGAIESVEGNKIIIQTPRGQVHVTVSPETLIQRMVEGSLEDLKAEVRVRVMGPRGEDGTVQARAITLVPERAEGAFEGTFGQRESRRGR